MTDKYIVWYCPTHGEQWPAQQDVKGFTAIASHMPCGDKPHFVRFTQSEMAIAQKLLPQPIVFGVAE